MTKLNVRLDLGILWLTFANDTSILSVSTVVPANSSVHTVKQVGLLSTTLQVV